MNSSQPHPFRSPLTTLPPALQLMLQFRARSLWRRVLRGVATPRKAFTTAIAVLLALVWFSQALLSILFRDAYLPETFRRGLLLSLFGYGVWPLLKAACVRPEHAIEWTPAEQEFLLGGPFTRKQLILYRLHVLLSSTIVKALGVSLLLLPDVGVWSLAYLGVLLALAFLELTRLTAETFFWGLPHRSYQLVRAVTLFSVGTLAIVCAGQALQATATSSGNGPVAFILILKFFACLKAMFETPLGYVATSPLTVFVELIASAGINSTFALNLGIAAVLLCGTYFLLLETDRRAPLWTSDEERSSWKLKSDSLAHSETNKEWRIRAVPRLAGAGPLAWRQLQSARSFSGALVVSLLIPGVLSALPLLMRHLDPVQSFINVAASLAFYSFLLLPSALKFDFRRDCDRLAILKTLPVSPLTVVIGQLATPLALTLMIQVPVLCLAFLVKSVPVNMLVWALLLLIPINLLIFGLENWFFLVHPHRIKEEGVQIFLRSILMFTAKGLLFAAALTVICFWAFSCRHLAELSFTPEFLDHRTIFGLGILAMTVAAGSMLLVVLGNAYQRFDPSMDLPS